MRRMLYIHRTGLGGMVGSPFLVSPSHHPFHCWTPSSYVTEYQLYQLYDEKVIFLRSCS